MNLLSLRAFICESNDIEGIKANVNQQLIPYENFLKNPVLEEELLFYLLDRIEPSARLRGDGDDVQIGSHRPIPGGVRVAYSLQEFLGQAQDLKSSPEQCYMIFENLHPFTDGNGRIGRAIWLWQHVNRGTFNPHLSFLEQFHRNTLSDFDKGT